MSEMVQFHGGELLKPMTLAGAMPITDQGRVPAPCRLTASSRGKGKFMMFGIGGFTPLDGVITGADRGEYRW